MGLHDDLSLSEVFEIRNSKASVKTLKEPLLRESTGLSQF